MMELKKKKILILWAKWMLWNAIFKFLVNKWIYKVVWTISWKQNNFKSFFVDDNYIEKIKVILDEWNFDYVLNCIWYIRPQLQNIEDYNKSLLINSHLPKTLQKLSYKYNFKLIHFSTDCVFDWKKWNYSINDIPNELSIYWISKYLGEINDKKNLTIRTSIIWIEEWAKSKNLLNWFLFNKDDKKVKWFSNVYWNWITTLTMAKVIDKIIFKNLDINWIIQLEWEKISKYDLLLLFKEVFKKKLIIEKEVSIKSDKTIIWTYEQKYFKRLILPLKNQLVELKNFYNL